jgi:hypothetical protein
MEPKKIEILVEGVLKVVKDGDLVAVVHNDMKKRSQVFYACKEMGVEDIKQLLESVNQK